MADGSVSEIYHAIRLSKGLSLMGMGGEGVKYMILKLTRKGLLNQS